MPLLKENGSNYLKTGIEPNIPYWAYVRNWELLGPFEFGKRVLQNSDWEKQRKACLQALSRPFINNEGAKDGPEEDWKQYEINLIDGYEWVDICYYYNTSAGKKSVFTDAGGKTFYRNLFSTGMNFCVAYARAKIYTPSDVNLRITASADDLIKLWVNEKEYYADTELRTLSSDPVILDNIHLHAGWNTLMAKIVNLHGAWKFSVKLETMDGTPLIVDELESGSHRDRKLKVKIGLVKMFLRDCMVEALYTGSDGLCIPSSAIITEGMQFLNPLFTVISRDYGNTWKKGFGGGCVFELKDGSLYSLSRDIEIGPKDGEFLAKSFRSNDRWKTVEGPFDVPVYCPDGVTGKDDQGNPCGLGVVQTPPVVMPDGRVLLPLYGWFKSDTVLDDLGTSFPDSGGYHKYRQFLLESKDNGKSFHYLSTIAYEPVDSGPEGFCEASIVLLKNGDILAAMRNGGEGDPIWLARSSDGGKTWSPPQKLLTRGGAYPQLVLLKNGILALSYVRNGTSILFSLDGLGHEWSHPVLLDHTGGNCQAMVEIEPGKLLQVVTRPLTEKVGYRQEKKEITGTLSRNIYIEK